jgi:hypothetical protein
VGNLMLIRHVDPDLCTFANAHRQAGQKVFVAHGDSHTVHITNEKDPYNLN